MEQRTDEWFTSRDNYMADLIVERLTGQKASSFSNAAMEWGTEQEPNARAAYSARTGELVEEVGFIDHPVIPMSGASPDGLVADGLVEFKCPNTSNHLDTLLADAVPGKYITQMQWQMACTGRPWCDFASYDDRLPAHLQMFVKRVQRDDKRIAELEIEVTKFLNELEEKLNKLQELNCG
jgi:putative phage-type endonuclease